ncbi:MAG: hypothetical protein E4H03_05725, partial [Myxococcales bacterium]
MIDMLQCKSFSWLGVVSLSAALGLMAPVHADAQTISFGKSTLTGPSLSNPTTLQFGPDGLLYVGQQNGQIKVYSVVRTAPNVYSATLMDTITQIQQIPNHNDDCTKSSPTPPSNNRLVTGLLVTGTPTTPVLYVSSSDPRIGGGGGATDTKLDTNSGVVTRLTWNGSTWDQLDVVRGLPRSEENHASNGMQLDTVTNTLYLVQGGHTNQGAPSNNFVFIPEYALSAAILSIDLAAIGETTYDIPTLDDEDKANPETNDPFCGNNGKNQAIIVPGGPVQVHSPGWRNAYDIVLTRSGDMYTVDNGPNGGWGAVPELEGPAGNCTNAVQEPGSTFQDNLHYVTGPGYYGGHPNPTRANTANTFNASNPQSPVPSGNAVECDYRQPGAGDGAMTTFGASTNGLAEYTASNFGGQMQGDLVIASFSNQIYRTALTAPGVGPTTVLFGAVGGNPLDVTTRGDSDEFPGTIWVAAHGGNSIIVYEPDDFIACTGADDAGLDEDGDCYDNADEIDAGSDPCSAGDLPEDADGDCESNFNDPDDDNDGIPDTSDPFAIDVDNGTTTNLPVVYEWENDAPNPGGLLNLGMTGLMTNGTSNYEDLFDPTNMTVVGAAGVVTVDLVPAGDAFQSGNDQEYAFQLGVDVGTGSGVFTVHTRVLAPFVGFPVQNFQSMGLFLGNGDQDNYVKLVTSANGGGGGVQFAIETGGSFTSVAQPSVPMPGPDHVDLFLEVDPAASTVTAYYQTTTGGTPATLTHVGSTQPIPSACITSTSFGLAVGILSTSTGGTPFPASWDFFEVTGGPAGCVTSGDCDDANVCTDDVCSAGLCVRTSNTASCDDGVTCTTGDVCAEGVCAGTDSCPVGFVCDIGSDQCVAAAGDPDNDGLDGPTDPCPLDPRNLCYGPLAVDGTTSNEIRLNANVSGAECSGTKVDCNGQTWLADFGFGLGGNASTCNLGGGGEGCVISGISTIFGCDDEETEDMFQCERWDPVAVPEMIYDFDVANGNYVVNLLFANAFTGTAAAGQRVFDIAIEGAVVYAGFDQVVAAGGSGIAVVRSAVVSVSDGNGLQIELLHGVENPAIKAIEVLSEGSPAGCDTDGECNDGNLCTTDTCVGAPGGTCSNLANTLPCDDGIPCTVGDQCGGGSCQPGTPNNSVCNDSEVCTDDVCSSVTGCTNPPNTASCDDGVACTSSDVCAGGTCGGTSNCTGGQICNPGSGLCETPPPVLYRVNAGGPLTATGGEPPPEWAEDQATSGAAGTAQNGTPSPFVVSPASPNTFGTASVITLDGTVPAAAPASLFQTERWDPAAAPEMQWSFPVAAGGEYEVRLYFAEICTCAQNPGQRVFDVSIEGALVLDDWDTAAQVGFETGTMRSFPVTDDGDGNLVIDFTHVTENPKVSAIEILSAAPVDNDNDGSFTPDDCNDNDDTVFPGAPELCDGKDNDCDVAADEDFPALGGACSVGIGECAAAGTTICSLDGLSTVCDATPGTPTTEVCDGLDNDCDGVADEGGPGGGGSCNTGLLGVCAAGTNLCVAGQIQCVGNTGPSTDVCDGLDNDCDGAVDEGNPGGGGQCGSTDVGECQFGTEQCQGGSIVCTGNVEPTAEICDGLDNDCDG